jgi:hypothetical protein
MAFCDLLHALLVSRAAAYNQLHAYTTNQFPRRLLGSSAREGLIRKVIVSATTTPYSMVIFSEIFYALFHGKEGV